MSMKNLGWNLFFALLLGDVVAIVMLRLGVALGIVTTVSGLVFAILAIVLFFANNANSRAKRREEAASAKLAELESRVKAEGQQINDVVEVTDEPAK